MVDPSSTYTSWFRPSSIEGRRNKGYLWVKQYGLTNKEIDDNYFWDDSGYFVFNTEHYQNGRNFTGSGPKYVTKGVISGNEKIFHGPLLSSSTIYITEDAISAIKVARVQNSLAIHKAVIPLDLILRLSRTYKHLIIWLDPDRNGVVALESCKASPYFESVRTIRTTKDPKYYSTTEIVRINEYD